MCAGSSTWWVGKDSGLHKTLGIFLLIIDSCQWILYYLYFLLLNKVLLVPIYFILYYSLPWLPSSSILVCCAGNRRKRLFTTCQIWSASSSGKPACLCQEARVLAGAEPSGFARYARKRLTLASTPTSEASPSPSFAVSLDVAVCSVSPASPASSTRRRSNRSGWRKASLMQCFRHWHRILWKKVSEDETMGAVTITYLPQL